MQSSDEASQWPSSHELRSGESHSPAPRSTASRVCDACIRKKVKCDQNRPTCSRCLERGATCTYSSIRRKPGPSRGSHHGPRSTRSQRSSGRQHHPLEPQSLNDEASLTEAVSTAENSPETSALPSLEPSQDASISPQLSNPLRISVQQEEYLLERFFDIVQDANPIFSKEYFLHNYRNSMCSKELIATIVAITAKLTGFCSTDFSDLDARIDYLLSSNSLELDMNGDSPSLDQVRKSYILAFYEFHQFPGNQAWMRISRLTRLAYRIELDHLENVRTLYPDWSTVSKNDLQEWRSVWWCIYRLDSYTNLASGTPYLIEANLVNTSLVLSQPCLLPQDGEHNTSQAIYLPRNYEGLWKILPALISDPDTFLANVHIVTVTALRHTAFAARSHFLRPHEEGNPSVQLAERHLAALRLALPPGWFNPKRNALSNESHSDHHARLVTVFHLLMAQILFAILNCRSRTDDEWASSWQQILETCQDIASTAAQWDSSFCLKVDPAVALVIFTALIFLELHKKSIAASAELSLLANIEHDTTILRLLLDQFAKIWTLPRLLVLSFKSFSESISWQLSVRQIQLILSSFQAPLHPRWLQFLSSAHTFLSNTC